MNFLPTLSLIIISTLVTARAAIFEIRNNCPYTVWAAASPGGGRQLDRNDVWWLYVAPGTKMARIWGRTGCNFDGSGRGSCQTGDCGGLSCTHWGSPPNTLAEYALNQYNNLDFFRDISLLDGFNIPTQFGPINNVGGGCRLLQCAANINGECPGPLRIPGGCNNPCTTFNEDQYCCNSGSCGPTGYSRFFKDRCPTSYSYPKDDVTSTFTCPGGTTIKLCSALEDILVWTQELMEVI